MKRCKEEICSMRILLFVFLIITILESNCGKPPPPSLLSEWEKLKEEEASALFQKSYEDYQKGNLERAIEGFEELHRLYPSSPEGDDSSYLLMLSHYRLNHDDEVLQWSGRLLKDYPDTPYRDHALLFEARIFNRRGENLEAAKRFGILLHSSTTLNILKECESALLNLLQEKMTLPELKSLLEITPPLKSTILLEIGLRELEAKRSEEGMESLRQLVEEFPESDAAEKAKEFLGKEQKRLPSNKIGLLLPLTGEAAAYGRAVQQGVELSLESNKLEESNWSILVKDTEGDPIIALERARELIEEDEVLAILGPVLSLTTIPVAARANDMRVPIISPTATDERISSIGPYVFQLNPSIRIHGRTMARFAVEKFGFSQFSLLYPSDGYGEEMIKVFSEEIEKLGGKILSSESYPLGMTDFQKLILGIKRTQPEALFIPAHPEEVLLIAPQLRFHRLETTILGGTGWGADRVVESKYAEGAFFPLNPVEGEEVSTGVEGFIRRFRERYNETPSHSSALGYDAMEILKSTQREEKEKLNRETIRERLTILENYRGASGLISLRAYSSRVGTVWTILKGRKIKVEEIEELPEEGENLEEDVPKEKEAEEEREKG